MADILRATCLLCQPPEVVSDDILDHLRVVHPEAYGDGFMRWPDGRLVVVDQTLDPADFTPPCCDLHGRNCEPPGDLCCESCTEARHGFWTDTSGRTWRYGHPPGEQCSSPDPSAPR